MEFRVVWSDEDNEYIGLCVDFPSLSWLAKIEEEAMWGIKAMVAGVIDDLNKTRLTNGQLIGGAFAKYVK